MYAPTNDADEGTKEDFYGKLQEVAEQVHKHDMLIITGDMNAKVGNLVNGPGRVMERHGLGTVNDHGERLKEFCDFNEMVITRTVFLPRKFTRKHGCCPMEEQKIREITLWLTENLEHRC